LVHAPRQNQIVHVECLHLSRAQVLRHRPLSMQLSPNCARISRQCTLCVQSPRAHASTYIAHLLHAFRGSLYMQRTTLPISVDLRRLTEFISCPHSTSTEHIKIIRTPVIPDEPPPGLSAGGCLPFCDLMEVQWLQSSSIILRFPYLRGRLAQGHPAAAQGLKSAGAHGNVRRCVHRERLTAKSIVAHHAPMETPTELCGTVRPVERNHLSDVKGRALCKVIILASLSSTYLVVRSGRTNQIILFRRVGCLSSHSM
jgi:hypothetical protein